MPDPNSQPKGLDGLDDVLAILVLLGFGKLIEGLVQALADEPTGIRRRNDFVAGLAGHDDLGIEVIVAAGDPALVDVILTQGIDDGRLLGIQACGQGTEHSVDGNTGSQIVLQLPVDRQGGEILVDVDFEAVAGRTDELAGRDSGFEGRLPALRTLALGGLESDAPLGVQGGGEGNDGADDLSLVDSVRHLRNAGFSRVDCRNR